MSILPQRCILCGQPTMQKCAYCAEPVCQRCAFVRKGKRYCREQHADMDHPLGRLFRRVGGDGSVHVR